MSERITHWTERDVTSFVFRIAADFVVQIERKMEAERMTRKKLAKVLGVSVGRVSQVLNDPGNLTLRNIVQYARALGMKAAVVAYDDCDKDNHNGPVNPGIFEACWQRAGCPADFFDLAHVGHMQSSAAAQRIVYIRGVGGGDSDSVWAGVIAEMRGFSPKSGSK